MRRPVLLDSPWTRLAYAAIAVSVLMLSLQVHPWSTLGNTDYYLRNAVDLSKGDLPHSRYSPGYPIVLVPLVALVDGRLTAMTIAASLFSVACAAVALVLLHRWLRLYVDQPAAALALTAFAVGQAATSYLGRGEVESLALLLVTALLLVGARGHRRTAVVLTLAAGLVRVALVPFLGLYWLLQLRTRPGTASAGLVAVAGSVFAHIAVGPTRDQSYADIAGAVYSGGHEGRPDVVQGVLLGAIDRVADYSRFGLPRLVWPHALLAVTPGLLAAAATTVAVLLGLLIVARRNWRHSSDLSRVPLMSTVAFGGYLAALLFWPIQPGETVRMVIPLAGLPLLGLAVLSQRVARTDSAARAGVAVVTVLVVVVGMASSVSVVAQRRNQPADERQFIEAHERVRERLPPGAVMSRKPAYTELALGRTTYEYPAGVRASDMAELVNRTGVCIFVIDAVNSGVAPELTRWLRSRSARSLVFGATEFVIYDSPRCSGKFTNLEGAELKGRAHDPSRSAEMAYERKPSSVGITTFTRDGHREATPGARAA